jgi:hypothetical protein
VDQTNGYYSRCSTIILEVRPRTPGSRPMLIISSKGTIPPEAQVADIKRKAKEAAEQADAEGDAKKVKVEDGGDSDEEVDEQLLQNGELEG